MGFGYLPKSLYIYYPTFVFTNGKTVGSLQKSYGKGLCPTVDHTGSPSSPCSLSFGHCDYPVMPGTHMFISQNISTRNSAHHLECSWTLMLCLNVTSQSGPLCSKFQCPSGNLHLLFPTAYYHYHTSNKSYNLLLNIFCLL